MIKFSLHAQARMEERGISEPGVLECLEYGIPNGPHTQDDGKVVMGYVLGDLVVILGPDLSVITTYIRS